MRNNTSVGTSIRQLPPEYTNVPPVTVGATAYAVPKVEGHVTPSQDLVANALENEQNWLNSVQSFLQQTEIAKDNYISWAGHHAALKRQPVRPKCISALLPLFQEQAHTIAMVRHSMGVVKQVIQHLNPGQIPVITADQPLYALAKQIQW